MKLKWNDKETRAVFVGWNNEVNDSLVACYSVIFSERSLDISENSSLFFSLADTNENSNPQPDEEADENGTNGTPAIPGTDAKDRDVNPNDQSNRERQINNNNTGDSGSEDEEDDEKPEPIDFSIELADSSGETIRFSLNDHAFLQPLMEVKLHKLEFMKTSPVSEPLYHFFYFPMRRFTTLNEKFSPEDIIRITFIFDKTEDGVIILDNLGFMPSAPENLVNIYNH